LRGVFSDAVRRGICSVVDGISGGRAEVTDSGRAGSNGRASWRAGLPVVLLLAVACAQVMLARTAGLSPWKGGGFGMFSTTDDAGRRHVRVFVSAHERSEEIAISPSLEDAAVRAAVLPSDGALSRLARRVIDREHRNRRPVEVVRIEAWHIEYAPETLAATSRLVREFVYRVDSTAASRH
jgi:hypothetical protein